MTPGKYDLDLYRGDSYGWRFALYTKDDQGVKSPVDLTGAVAKAEFRAKSGGALVMEFDCTIMLPNFVDMTISPDSWVDALKKGIWDLEVTLPGPAVHTPLAGKVTVTDDVTGSVIPPVALRALA